VKSGEDTIAEIVDTHLEVKINKMQDTDNFKWSGFKTIECGKAVLR